MLAAAAADHALRRAAAAAWPREVAAVLGGHRAGDAVHVATCLPCPDAGAGDHFAVAPTWFLAAEAALRDRGLACVGFAHSHPRASAAPSLRDRAELWPDCVQLILGAAAPDAWTVGAFWRDRETVQPLPYAIVPYAIAAGEVPA